MYQKLIDSEPETSVREIIQLDCSEGYSYLIQLYMNTETSPDNREIAINRVYEGARGVYGGLIKNIQSRLLEYCMKIFVKFSLSSITVHFNYSLLSSHLLPAFRFTLYPTRRIRLNISSISCL